MEDTALWGKLDLHKIFKKEIVKETSHLGDLGDHERKTRKRILKQKTERM